MSGYEKMESLKNGSSWGKFWWKTCGFECVKDHIFFSIWLFLLSRIAGMIDDLPSPHRPVRLLARPQSNTFQVSLTRVFPSCSRSSSLFPGIYPSSTSSVCATWLHHMPVPVQSSLRDLFGSLCHSRCLSDVSAPHLVFVCHFAQAFSSHLTQSGFLVASLYSTFLPIRPVLGTNGLCICRLCSVLAYICRNLPGHAVRRHRVCTERTGLDGRAFNRS